MLLVTLATSSNSLFLTNYLKRSVKHLCLSFLGQVKSLFKCCKFFNRYIEKPKIYQPSIIDVNSDAFQRSHKILRHPKVSERIRNIQKDFGNLLECATWCTCVFTSKKVANKSPKHFTLVPNPLPV